MTPRNYCSSLGLVLETKNASLGIDISYIYCQTTKIALWDLWISLHQLLTVPGVRGPDLEVMQSSILSWAARLRLQRLQ